MLARISLLVLVLALALTNLDGFPTTWFDEGVHLHVPKTLVTEGRYAERSAEGLRYGGATMGVGPAVLLPVAASLHLFGVSLAAARFPVALYLVATVIVLALLAQRLYGAPTALVAVLLVLGAPGLDFVPLGRQVLGEIPALGLFLLGVLLWIGPAAARRPHTWRDRVRLAVAGLAFGAAMTTKLTYVLILPGALVACWLLAGGEQRATRPGPPELRFPPASLLLPLVLPLTVAFAVLAAWFLALAQHIGAATLLGVLEETRATAGSSVLMLRPDRVGAALWQLVRPGVLFGLVPLALAYGLLLLRPSQPGVSGRALGWLLPALPPDPSAHLGHRLLVVFALLWAAWFVAATLGWTRYAFPTLVVAALLLANLLATLVVTPARHREPRLPRGMLGGVALRQVGAAALAGLLVVAGLGGLGRALLAPGDRSWRDAAAYLTSAVPADVLVETWEPELGFLTNHRYHYPPQRWLDLAVRERWLGLAPTLGAYDLGESVLGRAPDYVVVGRFARWTGMYRDQVAPPAYQLVATFGTYEIYRAQSGSAAPAPARAPGALEATGGGG